MTPQEIIKEIYKLPISERTKIKESLLEYSDAGNFDEPKKPPVSEEEFAKHLLAKGIIRKIPVGVTEEQDDFEPIEIEGEPLSETIIGERR